MSKWNEKEIETAARIFQQFHPQETMQNIYRRISIETGRSISSIHTRHHRWGNTFNNLKERYIWAARKARGAQGGKKHHPGVRKPRALHQFTFVNASVRPPDEIVAERDRAFTKGFRDFSGMLLGDPLIGRSALDRMHD